MVTSFQQRLTYSSRRNPCPICGKDHGCALSDDLVICLRGDHSWDVPGWQWRKEAQNGMGGVFVRDNEQNSTFDREEWKRKKAAEKEAERKRKANSLSEEQRDRNARKILKQLGLSTKHRQNLRNRGLSDAQIEEIGFKSVERGQRLIIPVSPDFPAANRDGSRLKNVSGYLVPLFNEHQQIIGFQIAADDRSRAKYPWLSEDKDFRLPNEEPPLTIRSVSVCREAWLAEGTLKPLIASVRLNKSFIGASGGHFASSPEILKRYLDFLQVVRVIISPDAGIGTNKHTQGLLLETIKLVESFGHEVRIAWWGQFQKTPNNDIDEIDPGTEIQYLTPTEFRRELGLDIAIDNTTSKDNESISEPNLSEYEAYQADIEQLEIPLEVEDTRTEERDARNFLDWVKGRFNKAASKYAKRFGKLPDNPQVNPQVYERQKSQVLGSKPNREISTLVKWNPPIQFVQDTLRWTPGVITDYSEWLYILGDWAEELAYIPGELPSFEEWLKLGRPRVIFKGGDRKKLIAEAHSKGFRLVKESSTTGQGKSHDSGELRLADLDINPNPKDENGKELKKPRIFRIDPNYRNPSTATVEKRYSPLIARHGGLDYDYSRTTPMGYPYAIKHQRGNPDKPFPDIADPCDLWESFRAVGEKGRFIPAGAESPICMVCKKNEDCNFRKSRASMLREENYISADIRSMSTPAHQDVMVIEESGVTLESSKQVEIFLGDLHKLIGKLFSRTKDPEHHQLLASIIDVIDAMATAVESFEPENKRHGASHFEVKRHLPKRHELEGTIQQNYYDNGYPIITKEGEKEAPLDPSLYTRFFKSGHRAAARGFAHARDVTSREPETIIQYAPSIKGLQKEIDSLLSENLLKIASGELTPEGKAKALRENLDYNAITPILKVVSGNRKINLQVKLDPVRGKKLVVTEPLSRPISVVKSVHFALFLDATECVTDLEQKLDLQKGEHILEIAQEKPRFDNLTITLIKNIGHCGKQRNSDSDSQFSMEKRIEKAVMAIAALHANSNNAIIDHKQFFNNWQELIGEGKPFYKGGWWFNHTRGSNEFLNTQVMVNIGLPNPNFGDGAAIHQVMTGKFVNPTNLTGRYGAWMQRKLVAELIQDIGRLRAHLRPDEKLYSYHLGNFTEQHIEAIQKAFPGAKVVELDVYDLCPEAAPKGIQQLRGIINATLQAVKNGISPTCEAIALQLETSKANVTQTLQRHLGKGFRWLKICSQNLLKALYRKSEQIESDDLTAARGDSHALDLKSSDRITEEELWAAREFFPAEVRGFLEGSATPEQIVEDMEALSEHHGSQRFERILQATPFSTALRLYQILISMLPEPLKSELQEFIKERDPVLIE